MIAGAVDFIFGQQATALVRKRRHTHHRNRLYHRFWSTAVNGSTNIQNVTFAEYGNYGPGSILQEGPRANIFWSS